MICLVLITDPVQQQTSADSHFVNNSANSAQVELPDPRHTHPKAVTEGGGGVPILPSLELYLVALSVENLRQAQTTQGRIQVLFCVFLLP
jgi:hypothetical protein